MKSTPDQAVYDFSYAIYKLAVRDYEDAGEPISKIPFLMRCLILVGELKGVVADISMHNQAIKYVIEGERFTFWLFEVPDPAEKFRYLDYLSNQLTNIFYNLNPEDCVR